MILQTTFRSLLITLLLFPQAVAQSRPAKVIIDTDIGDDIDDVFAIDLALASPEVQVIGLSAAWGDTALRARMLDRLTCEIGRTDLSIQTGPATQTTTAFTQKPWAEQGVDRPHGDAVSYLLDQIKRHPGEITLLAIGPLTNLGAAIDRDPVTFRKLKRVVLMGGAIHRGYDGPSGTHTATPPEPEYNIARDPAAAQKLFHSGVPIFMLPLDSTQLKFDEAKRAQFTTLSTPMTDALQLLTAEWQHASGNTTPTLFDPVAAAYTIDPATCPMSPLHIEVEANGLTRATPDAPNAQVCLSPHSEAFFPLLMPRLLDQRLAGHKLCTVLSGGGARVVRGDE